MVYCVTLINFLPLTERVSQFLVWEWHKEKCVRTLTSWNYIFIFSQFRKITLPMVEVWFFWIPCSSPFRLNIWDMTSKKKFYRILFFVMSRPSCLAWKGEEHRIQKTWTSTTLPFAYLRPCCNPLTNYLGLANWGAC